MSKQKKSTCDMSYSSRRQVIKAQVAADMQDIAVMILTYVNSSTWMIQVTGQGSINWVF